jgi:site-specific recombinase XerD
MRLLDQVRHSLPLRHRSEASTAACVARTQSHILSHGKTHLAELRPPDVVAFLEHLAVQEHVAESTQNQALCALVLLYDHVLQLPLGDIGRSARA